MQQPTGASPAKEGADASDEAKKDDTTGSPDKEGESKSKESGSSPSKKEDNEKAGI